MPVTDVRSFDGFDRPWRNLERVTEDVRVRELACGSGYIMTGRVPSRAGRPRRARQAADWTSCEAGAGCRWARVAWPPRNSAMTGPIWPGLSTSAR